MAQPDLNMGCIRPEKRTHFTSHLDRSVNWQALQMLNVERAAIELALQTLILVNTFPLAKHWSLHRNTFFLAQPHAKI